MAGQSQIKEAMPAVSRYTCMNITHTGIIFNHIILWQEISLVVFLSCFYLWPNFLWSALRRCLFDCTNIEHRISSPQTDERTNRTLVQALTKLSTWKNDWDQCINAALYAYRIGVQDSSKFSPFFLMYNRQPRKAIELTAVDLPPDNAATLSWNNNWRSYRWQATGS